ncbi:hypothetical protein JXA34_01035 [Patescibacteria group bacterium]|nr:hypothetical protein [Patescibacteria group bacterium]
MIKTLKVSSIIFACLGFFFLLVSVLSGLNYPDYWQAIQDSTASIDNISKSVYVFFLLSFSSYILGDYFENFSE